MKKKVIVFSDIDGTIIQKNTGEEREGLVKVSETKYGCSCMEPQSHELLRELDNEHEFVFVTSRGYESYSCIDWGFTPRHVLIEGGSVLLTDGRKDSDWDNDVKTLIGEELPLLEELRTTVCSLGYRMKYQHNEYLLDFFDDEYSRTKDKEQKQRKFETTRQKLYENPKIKNGFNIYSHNNGMIIVCKKLEKGEMIRKYISRFKNDQNIFTISAGDSMTDSTMFGITDRSFGPSGSGATDEYEISDSFESKLGFTSFILKGIKDISRKLDEINSERGEI